MRKNSMSVKISEKSEFENLWVSNICDRTSGEA